MMSQMRLTSSDISERAHHEEQHPAPVVPLERGDHLPVGARRMAVELVDPRRALEVVPRNLSLPCCGRWLVLVVIGVGCLGLGLAQRLCAAEAHLLHVLKGLARPLQFEVEVGYDLVQHPDVLLGEVKFVERCDFLLW